MDRILGLQNVESMRQTILLQEQMFKHQVRELHRTYNLQKKLMEELEKGLLQKRDSFFTRNDPKETSSSCSGNNLPMPIEFDLERQCESVPSNHRDLTGIDEETDVEVELTLGIGHCTRKQRSKQCISTQLRNSDHIGEHSSSSMGTSKGEECGNLGSNISSSSAYREGKKPHWLLQDLSLNRT